MNKETIEIKNSIEYWVGEAKEIMQMMDDNDEICSAFQIASYLRHFYLQGKEHGIWISDNTPRD